MRPFPVFDKQEEKVRPATAVEILGVAVTAVLGILANTQETRERFWGILALALVVATAAFYRPIAAKVVTWRHRRHNNRLARQELPRVKRFVAQFGELVDPNRDDTLARIFQNLRTEHPVRQVVSQSLHLFHNMVGHVAYRLDTDKPDFVHLTATLSEFSTLTFAFGDQCIQPVFQNLSPDLLQMLTPSLKSSLNDFQQRYVAFRDPYETFTKSLSGALRGEHLHLGMLHRPKPLV